MRDGQDLEALAYLLKLIANSREYGASSKLIYDSLLFKDMGRYGVPSQKQIIKALDWLNQRMIIHYTLRRDYPTLLSLGRDQPRRDDFENRLIPDPPIQIEIIDRHEIDRLYNKFLGSDSSSELAGHSGDKNTSIVVEVRLTDKEVVIWISDGSSIAINRLRTDSPQYNFINYLLSHPYSDIGRGTVQAEVVGCKSKKDLTELVRNIGFSKSLKKYFFPVCAENKVRFTPNVTLTPNELSQITEEANRQTKKYMNRNSS